MICASCGYEQEVGRFCGRCGARSVPDPSRGVERVMDDGVPPDGPPRRRALVAVMVAAVVAVAGITVVGGSASDDVSSSRSSSPEEALEVITSDHSRTAEPLATVALHDDVQCATRHGPVASGSECAVWALAFNAPVQHLGTADGQLFAATSDAVVGIDVASGEVLRRWDSRSFSQLVATDSHLVGVMEGDHRLVVHDVEGGGYWSVPLEERRWAWVTVTEEDVVVREPTLLRVLDVVDGSLRWSRDVGAAGADGTPIVARGLVLTVEHERLVALSLVDGDRVWGAEVTPRWPILLVPGSRVVVAGEDQRLVGIDVATGAVLWERLDVVRDALEVVRADDATVAVVHRNGADLFDAATGDATGHWPVPGTARLLPSSGGSYLHAAGALQRWSVARQGSDWHVVATVTRDAPLAFAPSPAGGERLVVAIGNRHTLAAFDVPPIDDATPPCVGARASWALGPLDAWAGDEAVAAVVSQPGDDQLLIAIPATQSRFRISARPLANTEEHRLATFAQLGEDDWSEELEVKTGSRLADGIGLHWVVESRFPSAGCWEISLTGDDLDDNVVMPVAKRNAGR